MTRVLLCFLGGALISSIFPDQQTILIYWVCLFFFLLHAIAVITSKHRYYNWGSWVSIPPLAVIFLLGFLRGQLNNHFNDLSHYSHYSDGLGWTGTVITPGVIKENFILYEVDISRLHMQDSTKSVRGKFNFYVRKDSTARILKYGDKIMVQGMPYAIPSPKNPDEFNYAAYMHTQHIYDQQFVDFSSIKPVGHSPPNQLLSAGYDIRSYFQSKITHHLGDTPESAVLSALILGIKDHLDNDLTRAYAAAGAMHVLAVSGLHVGIVFLILNFLLRPLNKVPGGKWVVLTIQLTGLWLYALITGFSPSVLRAVTMFSIMSLANTSDRGSNIYNTIALSAFVLLLWEPNYIYAVGFQLSYAAVIGIIYLQPKIYNLWIPKTRVLDWAWSITAVSIAAQLSTFPLGLYYFHQFPSYFFISNLVVIPGVMLILNLGFVFLAGAAVHETIGGVLASIIELLLNLLNGAVRIAEELPGSLIDWVYISSGQMVLIYVIILSLICVNHFRNLRWLYLCFTLALGLSYSYFKSFSQHSKETSIKFYRAKNYPAIDFYHYGRSYLVSSSDFINSELSAFQIDPHRRAILSHPVYEDGTNQAPAHHILEDGVTLYQWFDHSIIHVTQTPRNRYQPPLVCDELVISNNAITNKKQLDQFIFTNAIVDGSNFQTGRLKNLVEEEGLINLNDTGAFIVPLQVSAAGYY